MGQALPLLQAFYHAVEREAQPGKLVFADDRQTCGQISRADVLKSFVHPLDGVQESCSQSGTQDQTDDENHENADPETMTLPV